MWSLLSPHADTQGVGILFAVCLFVCTVTDFSGEDKASGVKFCTAVHGRPRRAISHFGELCSHSYMTIVTIKQWYEKNVSDMFARDISYKEIRKLIVTALQREMEISNVIDSFWTCYQLTLCVVLHCWIVNTFKSKLQCIELPQSVLEFSGGGGCWWIEPQLSARPSRRISHDNFGSRSWPVSVFWVLQMSFDILIFRLFGYSLIGLPLQKLRLLWFWLQFCVAWWLSGKALDLRFTGGWFNSRPVAFT